MAIPNVPADSEGLLRFVEEIKRQWMATIDALVDPLMIVRRDFTIEKANQAMAVWAKRPVRELPGRKCFEVFAGRTTPCKGCKMHQAAREGSTEQFSLDDVGTSERYYEVTSQPIYGPQRVIEGVVQVYRDRTQARKLNEQLMQSEKLASIGLLAGGVAHEINNPLGGILIFSQMLLRELDPESSHYQDAKEIEAAAKRCKDIVESLLDFARASGELRQAEEAVDVVEALQTALRFACVGHDSDTVTIEEHYSETPLAVKADRNKLIQLFLNLVQNAFQAMAEGGTLTLRAYPDADEQGAIQVIEVTDTGIGIDDKDLGRIFDPFFTTKEPGEGTGLGLAICFGIAEDMGGTLSVTSTPGEGSTFRVCLPRLATDASPKVS